MVHEIPQWIVFAQQEVACSWFAWNWVSSFPSSTPRIRERTPLIAREGHAWGREMPCDLGRIVQPVGL